MSRPMLLIFNFSDARLSKLRFLCMKLGLAVKAVPEADFGQPVSALCGLTEKTDAASIEEPFTEEMMIFCHMDHAAVNRFLQTARQLRFAPVALKAMLTPTNAEWTPVRLVSELREEREALRQGKAAEHEASGNAAKASPKGSDS